MNRNSTDLAQARQHQFGRRVARRLDAGSADLPYHVTERLRAARMQALAQRKLEPAQVVVGNGGQAALRDGGGLRLWQRLVSALPLVALAAGLIALHVELNDQRARELAEVDAALLTDDLPPEAYADPGFLQFLKTER